MIGDRWKKTFPIDRLEGAGMKVPSAILKWADQLFSRIAFVFEFRLGNYISSWLDLTGNRVCVWLSRRHFDMLKCWIANLLTCVIEFLLKFWLITSCFWLLTLNSLTWPLTFVNHLLFPIGNDLLLFFLLLSLFLLFCLSLVFLVHWLSWLCPLTPLLWPLLPSTWPKWNGMTSPKHVPNASCAKLQIRSPSVLLHTLCTISQHDLIAPIFKFKRIGSTANVQAYANCENWSKFKY